MFGMNLSTMELILNFYIIFIICSFSFSLLLTIFGVNLYKKANKKPSEALIPIYNLYILIQITELPIYYFLLFLFPILNIVLIIRIEYKLYKLFNTSLIFFLGMIFLPFVFIPLLSFGKYKYKSKKVDDVEDEIEKAIEETPILMSQDEIEKLNEEPVTKEEEDLDVDSIFKSDVEIIEETTPYKASKSETDEIYEEIKEKSKKERVEILDFKEMKKKDSKEDKIEIIDL